MSEFAVLDGRSSAWKVKARSAGEAIKKYIAAAEKHRIDVWKVEAILLIDLEE